MNPVILRPHLTLQREILVWCLEHDVPYTPRQWTESTTESVAKKTTPARKFYKAFKSLSKVLITKSPSHPFGTYQYASK
jgi:hypothetical protein